MAVKNKILLIDDEPEIHSIVKRMFQKKDFDFISSDNVKNAIEIIGTENKNKINLVIVDYNLGDGDSFDILQFLRKNDISIPTIIISGRKVDKLLSLEGGAISFISKPFENKELYYSVNNLLSLFQANKKLEENNSVIYALSKTLDNRDGYTENHSARVAEIATMLYYELGKNDENEIRTIQTGSLLHDIGKIGISDQMLKSSGKLTEEERKIMERHPIVGYEICKGIEDLKDSLPIIRHHHEKMDGTGYPDKLKGNEIPELVQIVTIADIFDALTSKRNYRSENGIEKALEIMEQETNEGKSNKNLFYIFKKMIYEKTGGVFEE